MITFTRLDTDGLDETIRVLSRMPKKLELIARRAIDKAGYEIQTAMINATAKKYYIRNRGELRGEMKIQHLPGHIDSVQIYVSGKYHTLAAYKLSPRVPPKGKRYHLKAAVKRGGGLKPLDGGPFLFKITPTYYIPMARLTDWKTPIVSLLGPAYPQIVEHAIEGENIYAGAQEAFSKEFRRQAAREIGVIR